MHGFLLGCVYLVLFTQSPMDGPFKPHYENNLVCTIFFKRFYLCIFREREKEGENEAEKHLLVASCMCPDWGVNPQPRHVP